MGAPPLVTTVSDLKGRIAGWRKAGHRVALVPTMGALHAGHVSLLAAGGCEKTVVSIFVNPAQFAPGEDFEAYPRSLESDLEKLPAAGLVFAPAPEEIYPAGFATTVTVKGPALGLESDFRPHFFDGVATVVARLLIAVEPDIAVFGEKDYQQLLVVRRLVADLGLPVEIVGAPVVRDADGLALSSRNAYLGADERRIAGRLNRVLARAVADLRAGTPPAHAGPRAEAALIEAGFDAVDYFAIRDAETLALIKNLTRPARILAAARIGRTRLIDNMAV